MEFIFFLIQIGVLIFSIVLHEISHGYAAFRYGDPTAKILGRLTLNPLKHLDLIGSVILPLLLFLLSGGKFVFGWAKPVPFNPYNLKNQKWGPALVGFAGPAANFTIALFFGLAIRFIPMFDIYSFKIIEFFGYVVLINLVLGVFNLFPIPPLDGSKILYSILPYSVFGFIELLERYSLIIFIFFLLFGLNFVFLIAQILFKLITGTPI